MRRDWASRIRRAHSSLALALVNTALAFLLVNVLAFTLPRAWRAIRGEPARPPGIAARYGLERLDQAHPEWSRKQLLDFLGEKARSEAFEYAPFTEFRQRPTSGTYINVSPAGYRHGRDQGPWPPDGHAFNLFVLGGSTAFGDGLADEQTIPSVLQELLAQGSPDPGRAVRVYNFGCSGYISSQERILFEQLLVSGHAVSAAVFIDGLNEFLYSDSDASPFLWQTSQTRVLRRLVEDQHRTSSFQRLRFFLENLPAVRLARDVSGPADVRRREREREGDRVWSDQEVSAAVARWQANARSIEAVAAAFGVPILFVWQPVPVHRYDLRHHLFHDERFPAFHGLRAGYGQMERKRAAGELSGLLWLADAQAGRAENLYVDAVHYDAAFSREIAAAIARALRERQLVP